jgi:hypothetical protein
MQTKYKGFLILSIIVLAIGSLFLVDTIAQSQAYHNFADKRFLCNTPNCFNVLSNIPFIIIGLLGILKCIQLFKTKQHLSLHYVLFFIAILFTGFGSAYYHLNPTTQSLLWDRLPMTLAFMSFFSVLISTAINKNLGRKLLFPLIAIGFLSILHWQYSEYVHKSDLRFYILVQFLPMLLMPIILTLYSFDKKTKCCFLLILLCYAAAKLCEAYDYEIHTVLKIVSGHTLKHVFAALAPLFLYQKIKEVT